MFGDPWSVYGRDEIFGFVRDYCTESYGAYENDARRANVRQRSRVPDGREQDDVGRRFSRPVRKRTNGADTVNATENVTNAARARVGALAGVQKTC